MASLFPGRGGVCRRLRRFLEVGRFKLDAVHFNDLGSFKLYRSLRGTLLWAASHQGACFDSPGRFGYRAFFDEWVTSICPRGQPLFVIKACWWLMKPIRDRQIFSQRLHVTILFKVGFRRVPIFPSSPFVFHVGDEDGNNYSFEIYWLHGYTSPMPN